MKLNLLIAMATLSYAAATYAGVYNVTDKSVQMQSQDGVQIQIQFRSETVSTSGSSVANTSAQAIQIRVANCEASAMTAKLRGVTTDGADVIQIVKLQKIGSCLLIGTPVYPLAIAIIDTGKFSVNQQTLEIESMGQLLTDSKNGTAVFSFNLGQ